MGGQGGMGGAYRGGMGMGGAGRGMGVKSEFGGENGGGGYSARGPSRPGNNHDFVEGKLFLGGLDTQTTKETLVEYCTQW